jgi:hypothetical protein
LDGICLAMLSITSQVGVLDGICLCNAGVGGSETCVVRESFLIAFQRMLIHLIWLPYELSRAIRVY